MGRLSSMRIVLVEDVALEAKIIQRALADVGYSNITVVDHPDRALAEVEKGARLVITDIELAGGSGITLAEKLRARAGGAYVYIIAMTGSAVGKRLTEAFEAGVDDFIAKPVGAQELRSRLRAAERIVGLEHELRIRVTELETALRRIDVAAAQRALLRAKEVAAEPITVSTAEPLEAVIHTPIWADAENVVAKALEDFLQLPFTACDDFREDPYATEIDLAEAAKEVSIVCNVTSNDDVTLRLAEHLLGERDLEGGKSLVLEIANVLMGALKTAYLKVGMSFGGGLPRDVDPQALRGTFGSTGRRKRLAFRTEDGFVLGVWLRCFETRAQELTVKQLVEGMVLKEDLFNEAGMLLVKGGTRLTRTTAERIVRFAPNAKVQIVSGTTPGGQAAA